MHFGSALEAALTEATAQGKRKKPLSDTQKNAKTQDVLARWLGPAVVKKRYRDPMTRLQ